MNNLSPEIINAIQCGGVPNIRNWRDLPPNELTRAERVLRFCERYILVPEGSMVGKPIKFLPYQEAFIYSIYDNPHGTRRAYNSIARKNGKTATIACLLLAHLVGTEARQNSQIISGAQSRDQASLVFNLACKMIMMSPKLSEIIKIIPSSKKLIGLPMNVEYKALAADGRTAHGLSGVLCILDELGQVRGAKDDFVDAIVTSQGAHENPLLIVISTQAASDADLLSIWLDDAKKSQKEDIVSHVYQAPADCNMDDKEAWIASNPALGIFRSEKDLAELANDAIRMPSNEPMFRNLNLNQRVNTISPFVSASIWKKSQAELYLDDFAGEECWLGLDLSFTQDLTALGMIFKRDDVFYSFMDFWSPYDTMFEREKRDRAPYTTWLKQGFIHKTEGKVIKLESVGARIGELLSDFDIKAIAYDNYRHKELAEDMQAMGIDAPFVEHPQGFRRAGLLKDAEGNNVLDDNGKPRENPLWMPSSIEKFETLLIEEKIKTQINPVLTMCAANCVVRVDPAGTGGKVFNKAKSTGRIDGMVALAMAVGAANSNTKVETVELNIRQL